MAVKVAIVAFGVEGKSAYDYFAKQGADITIFDESSKPQQPLPEGAKVVSGPDAFEKLQDFDVVVRTQSIAPWRIKTKGEVTSITKEFFRHCPSQEVIGVTATKGKGTIATLIYDILREAGVRTHLAGNLGVGLLDILEDIQPGDVPVLELSSSQLWDLAQSPHVAVVGMIEPEHLELHKDFEDYFNAKANIAKFQTAKDVVIFHATNEYSAKIASMSPGQHIRYATKEGAHLEGDTIVIEGQKVVETHEAQLPGPHNLENICAAITAAWQYTQDVTAIGKAVRNFKGLPYRMEFVREVNNVKFYNDSISTTAGSVIAAINSFDPTHEILIIGGRYDKGVEFNELAKALAKMQPKEVLFVGPIGAKIAALAKEEGYAQGGIFEDWSMQEIVQRAAERAKSGDVIILSPAAASFGDFKDYKDRGEQFKKAVGEV